MDDEVVAHANLVLDGEQRAERRQAANLSGPRTVQVQTQPAGWIQQRRESPEKTTTQDPTRERVAAIQVHRHIAEALLAGLHKGKGVGTDRFETGHVQPAGVADQGEELRVVVDTDLHAVEAPSVDDQVGQRGAAEAEHQRAAWRVRGATSNHVELQSQVGALAWPGQRTLGHSLSQRTQAARSAVQEDPQADLEAGIQRRDVDDRGRGGIVGERLQVRKTARAQLVAGEVDRCGRELWIEAGTRTHLARVQDVPKDVVVDNGQQVELRAGTQRRGLQGSQRLLEVTESVRTHRRPLQGGFTLQRGDRPGMSQEDRACAVSDQTQRGAPVVWQLIVGDDGFAHESVVEQLDELGLALQVVVDAHGAGAELGGDATHGDGGEAFGVGIGIIGAGRLSGHAQPVLFGSRLGSMGEYSVVRPEQCFPIPERLDPAIAAAAWNPGMSAWMTLELRARLQPGECVLVLGATGVTGNLAVPAARHLGAARVVAVGRNAESLERLRDLGADAVIRLDGDDEHLTADLERETGQHGFDVVVDYLWGHPTEVLLNWLDQRPYALRSERIRLIQVGAMAGESISLPASVLRSARLEILGNGTGTMPSVDTIKRVLGTLLRLLADGTFHIEIERVPLSRVAEVWNQDQRGRRIVFIP